MSENQRITADQVPWRDKNGQISCQKEKCDPKCEESCPIQLRAAGIDKLIANQPEHAIAFFDKAIRLAPDFSCAYSGIGSSYAMIGEYEKAYHCFMLALELDKNDTSALRDLIMTEMELGKYKDAFKHHRILERTAGTNTHMKRIRDDIIYHIRENVLQSLLADGRESGIIQSEKAPYIPEISNEADLTCARIIQGMSKYPHVNLKRKNLHPALTWACFAGMGAVYHWHKDQSAFSETGVFEILTKKRGLIKMDKYVLKCIGYPYRSLKGKTLRSYCSASAMKCYTDIYESGISQENEVIRLGSRVMFDFGMAFEINQLGMK